MTPSLPLPTSPPRSPASRAVTLASLFVAALVAALWGVIATQGAPPGGWGAPPQGGGYGAPPQVGYGQPGAPPIAPGAPQPAQPPPPRSSSPCGGAETCTYCACDVCVLEGLCEICVGCDAVSCQATTVALTTLAATPLLLPFAVLALWRQRERRRELAA